MGEGGLPRALRFPCARQPPQRSVGQNSSVAARPSSCAMTTRPQDMGPADLAPNTAPPETLTADQARRVLNNTFYNSLALGAKERFLAALEDAARMGLGEDEAWEQAVRAVEDNL